MKSLSSWRRECGLVCLFGLCVCLVAAAGCAPAVSTPQQQAIFTAAGSPPPAMEPRDVVLATVSVGPYRAVVGDILELDMPQVMRAVFPATADTGRIEPYLVRVRSDGTIDLPSAGTLEVGGKTLSAIEEAVAAAYFPSQLVNRPSVVARVQEYDTAKVSVTGAVNKPGVYDLRSDEMSLSAALMKAGGIAREGAQTIRVYRPSGDVVTLQVAHQSIPVADVALTGGETVQVECMPPMSFNVTGLVKKPGQFEYPPGARYTLLQAISVAGGMDTIADPQFVRIVRVGKDSDKAVDMVVRIASQEDLLACASILVKPGDSVMVMNTVRTDTRTTLSNVTQRIGFFAGASYDLNKNN
jgi:polysaccharide biosynthesis/export protein